MKDAELLALELVDELKSKRKWKQTVLDALSLITSLMDRRVDILEKLFPWIEDHYRARLAVKESLEVRQFSEMLEARFNALEVRLQPVALPAPAHHIDASNKMVMPEMPSIFVETKAPDLVTSGAEARINFAAGMGDLLGGDDADLWDD